MGPPFAGSKKRRREPHNIDVKLVELYEDLASEKDEIRLKAAQGLVSQFTPDQNPADEQIKKVLSRLFRGLCSSRKAARIGFSIALTEILTQVFSSPRETSRFSFSDALNLWDSQTSSAGSESGQEQRDHIFGRLFGAEAIIKSSVLFQPTVPFEQWIQVLDLVFELAQKKPWIREECGWIVYQCIYDLATRKMEAKYIEAALEGLCTHDIARSPEGVAIWLAAKDMFPSINFPSKVWKHDDPLDTKERSSLSKIMKESGAAANEGENKANIAKTSGVWNSKLHFAWDAVLSRTSIEAKDKSKKSRMTFADFWTEVVDNGLFAASSSDERKYWGFLLFNRVINDGGAQQASFTFTKNLMRCLTNQLAVEDRYLHRMAVKAAKAIQARVSKEPEFAAVAIRGLMGTSGTLNFDQATKTKTVEKIVAEANHEALEQIVPFFEQLIQNPGTTDEKTAASNRQFVAGLLLSIVRSKASATDSDAEDLQTSLEQILSIFIRFAYFMDAGKSSTSPEPAISSATQELLRNRINSCLNSLISNQKFAATLPYAVVKQIRDAAKSGEFGKFIIAIDEKLSESVKAAFKSLKKLSSREKKDKGMAAFKLLYSMTIMQVYNGDADAVSMLDELEFCYTKFLGEKETKEEDAGDASDALVEILLSFASKQSQLFRRMSEQVFGAFANQITENGLESLTSILEAKESLAGQQEMFEEQDDEGEEEGEDDDAEMMDVDEDEDELDSDVEVIEAGASGSDSDEDDEAEEENNEEDAQEIAAFEAKLAAALGTHGADGDESDSDADMNDDEMDELDDKLVQVFRARRQETSNRKDKKDARENMVNFKNRVLDLLEIFVKKSHSRLLALDILLPLLRLSRRSSVKQIATKANNVLREYTKVCKGNTLPKIEDAEQTEALWELLRSIHKEASHSGPMGHATACSQASLLVVKVLVAHDKDAIAGVVDVYAATRKDQLMSTKCHVQPSFFSEWNNWCVSASKQLK
ncbi:DNA polymerase V [Penicillium sp. IBT 31633x]|nr:DNA polymerase V [Penicillium sp. IBT 31633x]